MITDRMQSIDFGVICSLSLSYYHLPLLRHQISKSYFTSEPDLTSFLRLISLDFAYLGLFGHKARTVCFRLVVLHRSSSSPLPRVVYMVIEVRPKRQQTVRHSYALLNFSFVKQRKFDGAWSPLSSVLYTQVFFQFLLGKHNFAVSSTYTTESRFPPD